MTLRSQRLAEIREHIKAESSHDMKALLAGMTSDCFNDVAAVPKPFRGPKRVAERYQQHWAGFPDFKVRVKRLLAVGENTIVTENEWSGTHLGKFLGHPPTGKYVKVRALVVWHSKGRGFGEKQSFSTWADFLKKLARALPFRVIDEKPSHGIKDPDRSTFSIDSSLRAHPIIIIVVETANRHRFGFAEITCAGPRGGPRGPAVIPHPRSITRRVRIDFPVMCALPTSLRLSFKP